MSPAYPSRSSLHALFALFSLAIVSVASAATPQEEDAYRRGYVEALLDSRFPGHGLGVEAIDAEGGVTITSVACLGPWQKRRIERLLLRTDYVRSVRWHDPRACVDGTESLLRDVTTAPIDVTVLPEEELFAPLIADPRQPRFSVSLQRYKTPAEEFDAASVALGAYFPFASGFLGRSGASQIGIQGAVFALFNLDAPSKDLVNADYWIGIPLSYRRGPWSFLLRIYHQSSHLGDEFILGNPGVDRVNLSYEELEFVASHEWQRLRLYGGAGYIVHTSPSSPELEPKRLRAGAEYVRPVPMGGLDFVAATDVQASEELDWKYSRSYQVGFELTSGGTRWVRMMLEHYRGHSPNGQFFRERLRYTGIGVYFGF